MMHEVMDRTFKRFIGKHMLLIGFLAVLVPLGILLGMQYKWLTSLAETSAIAEKTWLNNYLEAVSSEVEYFYRKQAERGLNIPQVYEQSTRESRALLQEEKHRRGQVPVRRQVSTGQGQGLGQTDHLRRDP